MWCVGNILCYCWRAMLCLFTLIVFWSIWNARIKDIPWHHLRFPHLSIYGKRTNNPNYSICQFNNEDFKDRDRISYRKIKQQTKTHTKSQQQQQQKTITKKRDMSLPQPSISLSIYVDQELKNVNIKITIETNCVYRIRINKYHDETIFSF